MMKKRFISVVNGLLASAIILLGFGSCKTSSNLSSDKKNYNGESIDPAQPDPDKPPYVVEPRPKPVIEPAVTVYGPPPGRQRDTK